MNNKDFQWTKGCDMGFEVGQRAWAVRFGWGIILEINKHDGYGILWKSDIGFNEEFFLDGRYFQDDTTPSIFHKEQTFDFSKPEWQPKEGELVWAWDEDFKYPVITRSCGKNRFFGITDKNKTIMHFCAPFNNGQLPEQFRHLLEGGEV